MASNIWLRTILIVRNETRCRHIGYSFRLTARVLLYALSLGQDCTYHGLCYASRGALAGTRNSSVGPPHEGSIRRPIAPWANALTTELHLAPGGRVRCVALLFSIHRVVAASWWLCNKPEVLKGCPSACCYCCIHLQSNRLNENELHTKYTVLLLYVWNFSSRYFEHSVDHWRPLKEHWRGLLYIYIANVY